MLTPEKIEALNKVTGLKPITQPSARGNELRNLARLSQPETEVSKTFLGLKQGDESIAARAGEKVKAITKEEVTKAGDKFATTFKEAPGVASKTAAALTLPLKAAGATARIVGRSVAEPLQKLGEFIGSPIVKKIEEVVPGFSDEVASNVGKMAEIVAGKSEQLKKHIGEEEYSNLVDTFDVFSTFYTGKTVGAPLEKAVQETTEATLRAAKEGVEGLGKEAFAIADDVSSVFKPSQQAIDNYIIKNFEKGVKPTIIGRRTIDQANQYKNQAVEAVKIITENKNNLKFVTEEGEVAAGRLPETVREFSEAIDQTKRKIFTQYDSLSKQAGKAGGKVDGEGIVKELDAVVNNEALSVSNPEAIAYAKAVQNRLKTFDAEGNFTGYRKFDTETAQDIIKNYNNSLEAFYRNPSYDNASRAAIDAGVVNNFRKELDTVVEGLTGEEYQALKNQYAALKTIERDVVKRVNVLARQNNKSLLDYSDIFTGGQMVTGILSLNPALFAKGAIERGFKEWIKYLNNPNRAIRKMFEQSTVTPRGSTAPTSALGEFIANPKLGMSVEDVSKSPLGEKILATGEQKPTIKLKRDVTVTTLSGEKVTIPEDEVLKAYESGGKALLKDGREYIVSKSQYENIKNNSLKSEAKEFAPELKGTEESVRGGRDLENEIDLLLGDEAGQGMTRNEARDYLLQDAESTVATKYENYQLPEGKNYKEVLIKAPQKYKGTGSGLPDGYSYSTSIDGYQVINDSTKKVVGESQISQEKALQNALKEIGQDPIFKSSHWDEPNVISHLRLNERTYKGKKVTFMEELQSDWAREGRSKGFIDNKPDTFSVREDENVWVVKSDTTGKFVDVPKSRANNKEQALEYAKNNKLTEFGSMGGGKVPNNPLLKNWQELSVKRALKEAVDNNSEYLAWINGEQTSARYNLATKITDIKWDLPDIARSGDRKMIKLKPKEHPHAEMIEFEIDKAGVIKTVEDGTPTDWRGKKLDEVLGKGLADKIMEKESGTLSGDGLKFGGEWANNLYDKQVKNIVEDLTGGKVEVLDLGLPVEKTTKSFEIAKHGKVATGYTKLTPENIKIGDEIRQTGIDGDFYIITDVLGDGKFKAVQKDFYDTAIEGMKGERGQALANSKAALEREAETFDISTKTTTQQAIRITPEIRALVKGEALKLK